MIEKHKEEVKLFNHLNNLNPDNKTMFTRKSIRGEKQYFISKQNLINHYQHQQWATTNVCQPKLSDRSKNFLPAKIVKSIKRSIRATHFSKKDKVNGYEGFVLKPSTYDPKLIAFKKENATESLQEGVLKVHITDVMNKPYPFSPQEARDVHSSAEAY